MRGILNILWPINFERTSYIDSILVSSGELKSQKNLGKGNIAIFRWKTICASSAQWQYKNQYKYIYHIKTFVKSKPFEITTIFIKASLDFRQNAKLEKLNFSKSKCFYKLKLNHILCEIKTSFGKATAVKVRLDFWLKAKPEQLNFSKFKYFFTHIPCEIKTSFGKATAVKEHLDSRQKLSQNSWIYQNLNFFISFGIQVYINACLI